MSKPFSRLFELIEKKSTEPNKDELVRVRVDHIVPNKYQPRTQFSEARIEELATSISQHGLLQPITVRPIQEGFYEIIAGERRFRALHKLGFIETEVIVRYMSDDETAALALIENIQREDLSPIEEAQAYTKLLAIQGITQKDLAESIGKSPSFIANKLRLLKLSDDVKEALLNFEISERHARALLPIGDNSQKTIVGRVKKEKLNVRETEELVKKHKEMPGTLDFSDDVVFMMNDLNHEIEQLKHKGLDVESQTKETDDLIEVIVRVKKN